MTETCSKCGILIMDWEQQRLVREALEYFINSVLMDEEACDKLAEVLNTL